MIIPLNDECSIIEKVIDNLAIAPSTILIEKSKRRVPMEKYGSNLETLFDQLGNNIVIVCYSFFVDGTLAKGKDARP